jgi:hypothetical protein
MGLAVWCEDEAGPFQTVPYPGQRWRPESEPARVAHEYVRDGTAKVMALFHPATGRVRVRGTRSCTNEVLHGWMREQLGEVVGAPERPSLAHRAAWVRWQGGLAVRFTLPAEVPPLRALLVLDNLAGHKTPSLVLWLVAHGVMPLYTPLGGSWLNMAESVQRILIRRGLGGQHPETPEEIMAALEATARGWNANPTPFEWGGRRAVRRRRSRERRHTAGGSGAFTRHPTRRSQTALEQWQRALQTTH